MSTTENMETPELSFTLAYWVFCFCFVFTPNEFRSAGLTVQNLFSSRLGSEDMGFVQYHIRRSSITLLLHSGLPLGYYLGMCLAAPEQHMEHFKEVSEGWQLYLLVALSVHVGAWSLVLYWSMWKWENHPISRMLQAHARLPHTSWGSLAASLNTEFRRVDKFTAGVHGARVIVTDSWVLKVSTYGVSMALQSQCQMSVVHSRQHHMSPDSSSPTQILTLRVDSTNRAVRPFHIRLNSTEYSELRDKLHAPIRNLANVVIYQSVSELFLDTFRAQVQDNPSYSLPSAQELEPCIGCMQVPANIKLVQLCQSQGSDSDGDCQRCLCRPMWCVSCMGRWFASRQDQQRPETWLSSRVPCPTCRARFCILDVCVVSS
ncbi:E3 ubiquitin-protein ligase TM129 [Boleophthalmus pectinirostris]|uniref:E3 ubiquitin-protein ligase TM129 n=1 Tax=Boleophthalmus pectinirostris TaxID=150288 RepID=UPI000A1C72ED|nr:E3 ubiquitin-protein ligase TM129 [Boleophthalmus pectinirostris]XP_055015428.1 E3 ubiquitin-protein ligase TM129 [Boleophthalmus pectinirostris]